MPQSNSYHDIKGNPINLEDSTPPGVSGYHDATGKPIHVDLSSGGLLQPPPGYAPDPSNSQLPGASTEKVGADFYGKLAAQAPPMLGSFLGPEGTLLGSVVSQGMKAAAPSIFGQAPQSVGDYAKSLGVDLLTNEGIPRVLGWAGKTIARNLPAVKEGTANLLTKNIQSQLASKPESALLEKAASEAGNTATMAGHPYDPKIADFPNPIREANNALYNNAYSDLEAAAKAHADATTGLTSTPETTRKLNIYTNKFEDVPNPDFPAAQQKLADAKKAFKQQQQAFDSIKPENENAPTPEFKAAFGDNPTGKQLLKLRAAMTAGPEVASSQEYTPIKNKIFSDLQNVRNAKLVVSPQTVADLGYNKLIGGGERIDAAGILKELGNKSEIYKEAFGDKLPDFKNAISAIAEQQKGGLADTMMRYSGHHLIWAGLSGGAALTGHPKTAVMAGLMAISGPGLAKLMSSEYAPVVVAALKTPAGSPQAAVINEFMSAAIKSLGNAGVAAAKD